MFSIKCQCDGYDHATLLPNIFQRLAIATGIQLKQSPPMSGQPLPGDHSPISVSSHATLAFTYKPQGYSLRCWGCHTGFIRTAIISSVSLPQAFPQAQLPNPVGSQLYCQFSEKTDSQSGLFLLLVSCPSSHAPSPKPRWQTHCFLFLYDDCCW